MIGGVVFTFNSVESSDASSASNFLCNYIYDAIHLIGVRLSTCAVCVHNIVCVGGWVCKA